MKITITLDLDLTEGTDTNLVRSVIRDAAAEFAAGRHSFYTNVETERDRARSYVAERYPDTQDYKWLDREAKINEVVERTRIARALHHASFNDADIKIGED